MDYNASVIDLIRRRKSCRSYGPRALEMVRRGPSATNKQLWRIVKNDGAFHFFMQRTASYTRMTSAADLQRIDMGIAMCHFELTARELSLEGGWTAITPWPSSLPRRCEYVVS